MNAGDESGVVLGALDRALEVGPTTRISNGTVVYRDSDHNPDCRLVLTFSAGRLERIVLSADR